MFAYPKIPWLGRNYKNTKKFIPEETDIKLEPSLYFKRRNALIKSRYIPTLKEAEYFLGKLARFVYAECDEGLKHFVEHSMKGPPYGDMWIDPEKLLKEKMVLEAPPTKEHQRLLNHEGVLMVGAKIEQKLLNSMSKQKERLLSQEEERLLITFEKSIEDEIRNAIEKEREACLKDNQKLLKSIENAVEMELQYVTLKLQKEFEELQTQSEISIQEEWDRKINDAIVETTNNITAKFLENLYYQEENLSKHLKNEFMKHEIKRRFQIERNEADFKINLKFIKKRMECRNIANMMFIICMEKYRCKEQRTAMEEYYKNCIKDLLRTSSNNRATINALKEEIQKQRKALDIREICIKEVLKHYKSFIEMALKDSPKHANFLLSVEKMLLFELTETLSKYNPIPEAFVHCQKEDESEAEKEDKTVSSSEVSNEEGEEEEKSESVDQTYVFNSELYIRERFKTFQELLFETKGDPGDDLWGEDAELYIKTLKDSVSQIKISDSTLMELTKLVFPNKPENRPTKRLCVQFRQRDDLKSNQNLSKAQLPVIDDDNVQHKSLRYKRADNLCPVDYTQIITKEKDVKLDRSILGTKNSLELLIEKLHPIRKELQSKMQKINADNGKKDEDVAFLTHNENKSGILPLDTRNSIILRETCIAKKQKNFTLSPTDSIEIKLDNHPLLRKHSSKLLAARDSVIYLRESKQALVATGVCVICHRELAKDEDFCCDRCAPQNLENKNGSIIKKTKLLKPSEQHTQIVLTHVDIIELEKPPSAVVILPDPINIYEPMEKTVVKDGKSFKVKKAKKYRDRCEDVFVPVAKIEGDPTFKEYRQSSEEFTRKRVKSFIKLMDTHPNLIRLFTSCQQ